VLVEIALQNTGNAPVVLKQPIGDKYGTVTIEIRGPDSADFFALRTGYTGLKELLGYRSQLAPGETYAAHILLLCNLRDEWVFPRSGRYELRARIQYRDGEALSSPIRIDVQAEDPAIAEKLAGARADLCHISLEEALASDRIERIAKAVSELPEYRTALQWVQATAYVDPKDTASRPALNAKLEALRDSAPSGSPWRELTTATLAHRYAKAADTAKAERLLAELKNRSELTDKARHAIGEQKSEP
jgi:hypothetical protein